MRPLLVLLILGVSGANCGSHSMQYFFTGVSETGHGLPLFSIVGFMDNEQIVKYDSDVGRTRPAVQWMEKIVEDEPGYWEAQTQAGKGNEAVFKHNVKTAMSRFNQTAGFHSFQNMYGCELYDEGSTRGYDQYGYDGREFLTLDTDRGIYVPIMTEAQITTQRWNSPEVGEAERNKNYLQGECIEYLRKYIRAGSADLERKVLSQVRVSGHQSDAVTKLHCRVYGFYPKAVHVKWVKNGEIDLMSEEVAQVLPNPDGTYQLRVTVEVIPKDGDSFSCHVDHSSLKEPLTVLWGDGHQDTPDVAVEMVEDPAGEARAAQTGTASYTQDDADRILFAPLSRTTEQQLIQVTYRGLAVTRRNEMLNREPVCCEPKKDFTLYNILAVVGVILLIAAAAGVAGYFIKKN